MGIDVLRPFLNPQRLRELVRRGYEIKDIEPWTSKLIYSSYYDTLAPTLRYRKRLADKATHAKSEFEQRVQIQRMESVPVALKLLAGAGGGGGREVTYSAECDDDQSSSQSIPQYPYKFYTSTESENKYPIISKPQFTKLDEPLFPEDLGSPDPSIPSSHVPCGGCGAYLHCQEPSIPGYVPSERFKRMKRQELVTEKCQRCYFLSTYNTALKINVTPDDYPKILNQIRDKDGLVLLVVDLLDFPCSLWPGIMDIIGTRRPVILIGNKVDLLPPDSRNTINCVRDSLEQCARMAGLGNANIIHTSVVSARTGFGIEQLINKILSNWKFRGDIYLMGCTNVGKSSIFNALLGSDLCKVQATDLVQRATISPFPGTTLNLLKFPTARPDRWRLYMRTKRLMDDAQSLSTLEKHREHKLRETGDPEYATFVGHVGKTFIDLKLLDTAKHVYHEKDIFSVGNPFSKIPPREAEEPKVLNENDGVIANSKWCYDTPGAVGDNQILDLLTIDELMMTLPKEIILPRTYLLKPGLSLFVGGLSRVDYFDGTLNRDILLIVFASKHLPVSIVRTEDAEEFYDQALGTPILGVPFGSPERLKEFPKLQARKFKGIGTGYRLSCADLVISSAGWIGICAGVDKEIHLRAHTPNGKGIFCRVPSFLPEIVRRKGGRIQGSLAYSSFRPILTTV